MTLVCVKLSHKISQCSIFQPVKKVLPKIGNKANGLTKWHRKDAPTEMWQAPALPPGSSLCGAATGALEMPESLKKDGVL